jgi:hypothetical protein
MSDEKINNDLKSQNLPEENPNQSDNKLKDELKDINKESSQNNQEIKDFQENSKNEANLSEKKDYVDPINDQAKFLNPDYFDEFGRPKYEDVVNFENQLRAEIEQTSPLVSDKLAISYLINEFHDSNFMNSVVDITQKYKFIRTVRRDGNCFYRSFMFRLFEELSLKKQSKLYNEVVKVVEDSKTLCEKNGYQWMVFEDFYNMFISEWKFVYQLDPLNSAEYM